MAKVTISENVCKGCGLALAIERRVGIVGEIRLLARLYIADGKCSRRVQPLNCISNRKWVEQYPERVCRNRKFRLRQSLRDTLGKARAESKDLLGVV